MKPITEFRQATNVENCLTLYVNGLETNIYYFTPKYKHYSVTNPDDKGNAIIAQILIEQEQVKPAKGETWEGFDLCAHCDVLPSEVIEITETPDYKNNIQGMSGGTPDKERVINEFKAGVKFTQYCKRLIDGGISSKVGIKFYPYGYQAAFIK